jgi:hypothetical protein
MPEANDEARDHDYSVRKWAREKEEDYFSKNEHM